MAASLSVSAEHEDAARELAGLERLDRAADLLERVAARDELVDLEPPAEVELGQHREVPPRPRGPVAAAEDRLVLIERLHDELRARTELRHADDRARAPRAERVERLADHAHVADRLEGIVGAAAGQVAHRADGILARGVD